MKKAIIICCIYFLAYFAVLATQVNARILPRFQNKGAPKGTVYSGLIVSPRLRTDRRALLVTFNNLQKVKNTTYTLIYQTAGKDEGASGSLDSSTGNSLNRELIFGTCSSGVCRYHTNLTSMRFEVISELPSGKRSLKRYRIRI